MHNQGVVTKHYLDVCAEHGYDCKDIKRGDSLEVSPSYFAEAHAIVYELGVKLTHVLWRKLVPQEKSIADEHFAGAIIYELVAQRRYKLAQTLADFGVATFKSFGSEYFRLALVINRAQSYIWDGEVEKGLRILDEEDWSAAKDELQLGVAALRNDEGKVISLMESIGRAERPGKLGYREWPVFKDMRKNDAFQKAFQDVFGEPLLETKVVSQSPTVTIARH